MTEATLATITNEHLDTGEDNADNSGNYAKNGMIYKDLCKVFRHTQESINDFTELLLDAIQNKIWLGFINPVSGEFCSFIHHKADGSIDEKVSFKLWLATGEKKGGLGITDISQLASLCANDKNICDQVFPLLADNGSVFVTNKLREAQGEPPIKKVSKARQHFLKKIQTAPEIVKYFFFDLDLPQSFILNVLSKLEELPEETQAEIIDKLDDLQDDLNVIANKHEMEELIAGVVGFKLRYSVTLDFDNIDYTAKKICEVSDKDGIKLLIEQLQNLLTSLE